MAAGVCARAQRESSYSLSVFGRRRIAHQCSQHKHDIRGPFRINIKLLSSHRKPAAHRTSSQHERGQRSRRTRRTLQWRYVTLRTVGVASVIRVVWSYCCDRSFFVRIDWWFTEVRACPFYRLKKKKFSWYYEFIVETRNFFFLW